MAKIYPSISREFIDFRPEPFHPYVFVRTSRRAPTSVAMAGAAGGSMKVIDLPVTFAAENLADVP
jgi:hypothetical protein